MAPTCTALPYCTSPQAGNHASRAVLPTHQKVATLYTFACAPPRQVHPGPSAARRGQTASPGTHPVPTMPAWLCHRAACTAAPTQWDPCELGPRTPTPPTLQTPFASVRLRTPSPKRKRGSAYALAVTPGPPDGCAPRGILLSLGLSLGKMPSSSPRPAANRLAPAAAVMMAFGLETRLVVTPALTM